MMDWEAAQEPRCGAADHRLDEPASVSPGEVIVAPPRSLLKRERHCLEIKDRFVCLLQEVYAEISLEEFAGFVSVCQQGIRRAEDNRESPDPEMQ